MKTKLITLGILLICFCFTACKKDKTPQKPTSEKILGKWNLISITTEVTEPPKPTETTTSPTKTGDYLDFRADGKVAVVTNGSKEYIETYSIKSETEFILDDRTFTINELNNGKFTFSYNESGDGTTAKAIFKLSK
jgi:hypothetical protein